jgi:transposase
VPEPATQAMRALLRTRKQLVREQASHVQRLQKTLEDANIKLSCVLASVVGLSGRDIIKAIIAGESDPDQLLTLVHRGVKTPREKIRAALQGRITNQHRFLLRLHLRQIDALDAAIGEIDAEVDRDLDPFRQAVRLLRTHPGLSDLSAQVVISEIGIDMSRFPTAGHLVSWSGLCPRNDESAGKRRSNRLRKGAPWLKTMLVQCAWGAVRKKGSYYQAQFQRLRHRRGPKKAICAVAASILTAIYHMLRNGTVYKDLGADHFTRSPEAQAHRLAKQIAKLGFTCTIKAKQAEAVSI